MTQALAPSFLEHKRNRLPPPLGTTRVRTVEIVAPDQYCADLLLEYAAPSFRAEIVAGPAWIVSLQPLATEGGWVPGLLALVERWLESVPLPCTTVRYGGRGYLIRTTTNIAQLAAAVRTAQHPFASLGVNE